MHNEAFAKLGLDYCYMCYEVDHENLEKTVEGLKAMKVRGWNVSMPNKTTIVKYLDHLTPVAKMGQAVNTVINDDGVLTGTTTDGVSFIKVLKESNLDPIGKKITIVGAGGAAQSGRGGGWYFVPAAFAGGSERRPGHPCHCAG